MWSQEGQREPATGRMGPLLGQEKLPKSSALLNGVPGGQGGVETRRWRPQVVHGELAGRWQTAVGTLSICWHFWGELSPQRRLSPSLQWPAVGSRAGKPASTALLTPAGLQEVWGGHRGGRNGGWPPLEEGEPLGFLPCDSLSLEGRFSGLDETGWQGG